MGNRRDARFGSFTAILIASIATTTVACTISEPSRRVTQGSGAGGSNPSTSGAAGDVSIFPDTGAAGASGVVTPSGFAGTTGSAGSGSSCITGGAGSAGMIRSPFMPQIPSAVTHAATPVPPLSGGTLLALADGNTVVASDPDRDVVYVTDLTTNTVRAKIAFKAGDEPGRLAQDAAGNVYVALRRGGAIATIDSKAGTLVARRSVCSAPRGIAYEASTSLLHVACAGGELVSLLPTGNTVARKLVLDGDLRDVVVGARGTLLVSTFRKAEVLVVASDGRIASRLTPGSGMVPSVTGPAQMRTPSVAWRMASLGDGSGTVVMLHQTGTTDTVDPASGGYAGLKGCGGIVQTGVTKLSQDAALSPQVASGVGNVSLAVDLAVSPDGTKTAIAVPGNAQVSGMPTLVEGSTDQLTGGLVSPCGAPGLSIPNAPTGEVIAVSYAGTGTGILLAQTREPAAIWRADTGASIGLATDPRSDTGHFIFHVNAGGGLACASCHPEGGEDGRVWNFACQGARRTQSIRGGITPTAPFHWDGTETDFSRLMGDVFSGRMAGPALSTDQAMAVQAWVDTIPALPPMAGLDAAAVARGKTLFNDANVGCATCHAGTLLTNNATVDVGTGSPLQVPSLRGVVWRGPFMHTGCATTLGDRFAAACGGGDKHGVTSTLSAAQLGDLTTYLQSL
jgi:mono/diheme cytochrome c family protein